jgi:hypothetical protein
VVGAELDLREVEVDEEEECEEEEEGLGVEYGIENVGYEKYDENCVHFDFLINIFFNFLIFFLINI